MIVPMADDRLARWAQGVMQTGALLAPLGLLVSVGILYASFALLALGALVARAQVWRLPGFYWSLALGIWMSVIAISHGYRYSGIIYVWPMVYVLAIGMSLPWARRWAPWVLCGSLLAAGTLAALQFSIGLGSNRPWRIDPNGEQWQRAVGFFSHHIRFGTVMAVVAVLFTVRLAPQLPRWIGPVGAGLALALCVISSARGQLLALFAGLWLRVAGGGWRQMLIGGLGVLLLAGCALLFLYLTQADRLARLMSLQDVRWTLWGMCFELWSQAPFFGIGVGLNEALLAHYGEETLQLRFAGWTQPGHAHNSFISLGMDYGIPALLLFLGWLGLLLRGLWRLSAEHPAARSAILGVAAIFIIGGLTEDLAGLAYSRFSFVIGIGWLWAISCHRGDHGAATESPS